MDLEGNLKFELQLSVGVVLCVSHKLLNFDSIIISPVCKAGRRTSLASAALEANRKCCKREPRAKKTMVAPQIEFKIFFEKKGDMLINNPRNGSSSNGVYYNLKFL